MTIIQIFTDVAQTLCLTNFNNVFLLYIECCKLQIIIDFLHIFNTYKTNAICDNGHIYYNIIKYKFYDFKKKFQYHYKYLNLDANFEVNP